MTINLADNDPRISYAVAASVTQSSFTVPFEFFKDADLNLYVDGTLKTLATHYTVSGGSGSTGTITMTSGNEVIGISGGSTVVVTRAIDIERTTDFQTSGPFAIAALNEELDKLVAIQADLKDQADRSLQLTDFDADASLTLPDVNTRKGKTLAFNGVTGAVESGPSIDDVQTVSAASADIATLADIQDGTVDTNAITTAAGISSNISTVSGISANVTSVANNETNINTVATDLSGSNTVGTVAASIANVNTLAGINANITTVAGVSADVTTVATYYTDLQTVAADIASVVTAASDLNEAVSEIDVVANNIADVNTCGTNIAAIQDAPNQASAAAASASTAASHLSTFQDSFQSSASAPTSPTEGDLWYDTTNSQLKVYVGSSFQVAGAYLQGLTTNHVFTATAAQTTFTTDDAGNTMTIYANGNTLVFLNGVRLVEGTSSTNDYYISGSDIILNSGVAAGDILYVEVFTKVSTTQETSLNNLVSQASTSASNAATSEANAAASASASSADATSTAADVVSTNADVVSTNADVVSSAASASAAATSASNAATSEANAATSAAQAAASAGGGTLKISSADTTADVLENKLIAGTGITSTKNNAGGNETITLSVNPFSLTETNSTATAGQTSFSVSYTAGLIQVFMNGIKLISGSDFTATNGTSVVLTSGAAAGDVLEFVVFG